MKRAMNEGSVGAALSRDPLTDVLRSRRKAAPTVGKVGSFNFVARADWFEACTLRPFDPVVVMNRLPAVVALVASLLVGLVPFVRGAAVE